MPEFIPFKYNSFPINGARQSFLLTRALQAQIDRKARGGKLADLPPILTFQSVVDFTVSTRSIITALYDRLPANGSELVLFDLNRTIKFGPLLSTGADLHPQPRPAAAAARLPRHDPGHRMPRDSPAMLERTTEAGATDEQVRPLDLTYPLGRVLPLPRCPALPARGRPVRPAPRPQGRFRHPAAAPSPPAASAGR